MPSRALLFIFAALLSSPVYGQATWQPSMPPLVTAENTTWFQSGEPIVWNGDYYYPAGALQGFNQYQMVRSGSFRGIPLYTDATLEPYSIVFVPLAGARMQPYERRRTGALAGTTGSRTPSLPTDIGAEGVAPPASIAQAPGPPTFARAYDVAPVEEAPVVMVTGPVARRVEGPVAVGTSGRVAAPPSAPVRPVTTVIPPSGANTIWIEYDGRKWFAGGKAIEYDAERLNEVGSYRGFTVYALKGDRTAKTIYIPSIAGRLSPYTAK